MTPDQRLHELRKELARNSRLAELLAEVARDYADTALRKQYTTNEPGLLIRQAGMAEGAEKFVASVTKLPSTTPVRKQPDWNDDLPKD